MNQTKQKKSRNLGKGYGSEIRIRVPFGDIILHQIANKRKGVGTFE